MFDSFWALSGQRGYNIGGPNPITIGDMVSMLDGIGITAYESREAYIAAWCAMDRSFLDYTIKRIAAKKKSDEETPPEE